MRNGVAWGDVEEEASVDVEVAVADELVVPRMDDSTIDVDHPPTELDEEDDSSTGVDDPVTEGDQGVVDELYPGMLV